MLYTCYLYHKDAGRGQDDAAVKQACVECIPVSLVQLLPQLKVALMLLTYERRPQKQVDSSCQRRISHTKEDNDRKLVDC